MDGESHRVIRGYLDNVQVNLQTAQYTRVPPTWGTTVTMPDVTRLYFIRGGEGWISIRNQRYVPKPGQLFLLPTGQTISFDTDAVHPIEKYWCHFTATVGDVNLFQFIHLPPYIGVPDEAWLEEQFQRLLHLYQNPVISSPLRIKSVLLEIISMYIDAAVLANHPVTVVSSPNVDKINTLLIHIDQHLTESIRIQDLANLVHLHPQYLILYFKQMLGVSPLNYINRKRIERAKQLLSDERLTINEVASSIGWEGYYLSRMFKQQTGLSPTQYRDSLRATWSRP